MGLGATVTSLIFTVGILGVVTYLAVTKADVIPSSTDFAADEAAERGGLWQTVAVVVVVLLASGTGYSLRKESLAEDTSAPAAAAPSTSDQNLPLARQPAVAGQSPPAQVSPLGDVSTFRTITQDTLSLLTAGDQSGATTRITDLETEWDNAQARLKAKNSAEWTRIDDKIDAVLRALAAPQARTCPPRRPRSPTCSPHSTDPTRRLVKHDRHELTGYPLPPEAPSCLSRGSTEGRGTIHRRGEATHAAKAFGMSRATLYRDTDVTHHPAERAGGPPPAPLPPICLSPRVRRWCWSATFSPPATKSREASPRSARTEPRAR